ncbi:hypothetical protein [Methylorubrum extorquens]|uniref:hypothetical protein n=1 Tax=Methylorubrum extorquens TaxID=408 RepID=UPI0020A1ABA7|nr:hypothetical protein [Methylorubrum extorquens]MCP1539778.1 hypothetical protein [Methylorubrum extorquens]
MSHHLAHISADAGSRFLLVGASLHCGIQQVARDAERNRRRDLGAVEALGVELIETRRVLASSRAEISAVQRDAAALGRELAAANARAVRAEADLARLARAAQRQA